MAEYLKDKERFADLFNANLFEGRKVIAAEQLEDSAETYKDEYKNVDVSDKIDDNEIRVKIKDSSTTRYRDIKMRLQGGGVLRVLAIEEQEYVDYTMPWRHLNYDSLEYGSQLRSLKKKNKARGKYANSAEKMCGILKTDRLIPTYTLCLYHGKEQWDGPRSLKDMMDFGNDKDIWEKVFADYRFHLVCVNEQTDFSRYHSSLKELLQLVAKREDRKALVQIIKSDPIYQRLDEETVKAASVLLGNKRLTLKKNRNEEGTYNMCKALDELVEESKREGQREGQLSGMIAFLELCQEFGLQKEAAIDRLVQKFNLERRYAQECVNKYWK